MKKSELKDENKTLRIIISALNEGAPSLHQKLYDQRIKIKVLSDQLDAEQKDATQICKENFELREKYEDLLKKNAECFGVELELRVKNKLSEDSIDLYLNKVPEWQKELTDLRAACKLQEHNAGVYLEQVTRKELIIKEKDEKVKDLEEVLAACSENSRQRLEKLNDCAAMNRKVGLQNSKLEEEIKTYKVNAEQWFKDYENMSVSEAVAAWRNEATYNRERITRLENRELELLAEIKDLKESKVLLQRLKHECGLNFGVPTPDRQVVEGEEVSGEHTYNNIGEDI